MDNQELLAEHIEEIHPAIDFKDDSIIVGFKLREKKTHTTNNITTTTISTAPFYIISEGEDKYRIDKEKVITLVGKDYVIENTSGLPFVNDRWLYTDIKAFLKKHEYDKQFFFSMRETISNHIYFEEDKYYDLVALWIIGTYFVHMFLAYPYLFFHGSKETGKSNTLNIIVSLSFNGNKLVSITESAIGNYTTFKRGTLCIDQVENIKSDLVSLIADGYKKNGGQRQVMKGGDLCEFSTFGAKAFGSFKPLPHDLSDRCIQFYTVQAKKGSVKDFTGNEPVWGKLRNDTYRFLLMKFKDVRRYYDELSSDGSRRGELWKPLHAVAKALFFSDNDIDEIKSVFDICMYREDTPLTLMELALLMVLYSQCKTAENDEFEMTPLQIRNLMNDYLQDKTLPSPQWIGQKISLFNLLEEDDNGEEEHEKLNSKKKKTRNKHVHYTFKVSIVSNVIKNYPSIPELSKTFVKQTT